MSSAANRQIVDLLGQLQAGGGAGGTPSGAAGGDLSGTYPNPTVTSVAHVTTGILSGADGGTGVANTGKTITLANTLATSGNFALTLTQTGATNVTLPTTGTLATLSGTETISGKTFTDMVLPNGTWVTTPDSHQRLFFASNAGTYLKSGSTDVILRDSADVNVADFSAAAAILPASMTLNGLTASRPVETDSNKTFITPTTSQFRTDISAVGIGDDASTALIDVAFVKAVPNVTLTSAVSTTFDAFSVPAGKTFVCTGSFAVITSASAVTTNGQWNIVDSAGGTLTANSAVAGTWATPGLMKETINIQNSVYSTSAAGVVVRVNIVAQAVATTQTATVYIQGFYY